MLRPLPFPDSDRLMVLCDRLEGVNVGGATKSASRSPISRLTRARHGFTALGGYQGTGYELSGTGEPAQINAARMTAGVFTALGVQPPLGRVFTEDEASTASRSPC